jgi:hypothetical protein
MTVFNDGTWRLRPAQLTACSSGEMEGVLWGSLDARRSSVVVLTHNFELLNAARRSRDSTVVERYQRFCAFLDRNRDCFETRTFEAAPRLHFDSQPAPLSSPLWKTSVRFMQQIARTRFG